MFETLGRVRDGAKRFDHAAERVINPFPLQAHAQTN